MWRPRMLQYLHANLSSSYFFKVSSGDTNFFGNENMNGKSNLLIFHSKKILQRKKERNGDKRQVSANQQ